MDTLPGDAAVGYLFADGLRTNVLHLPVVGFGDGGAFTKVADVHRLWSALVGGRLGQDMLTTLTTRPVPGARYGMGMWLDKNPGQLTMEGMDAGCRSARHAFLTAPHSACYRTQAILHGRWPNTSQQCSATPPDQASCRVRATRFSTHASRMRSARLPENGEKHRPSRIVEGRRVLLDEWQHLPFTLDLIRRAVDLAIITTGKHAYRRPDVVAVIPAALLGP